ncbi:ABC transporter permease [Listeria costaricensis]|uniref:ABC transporter permease n=1 Tax=Listeria costaricensis TaxID=2026604 RepID=UPI000C082FF2|nr:ABC transporter permease [Listeria costaricensis]
MRTLAIVKRIILQFKRDKRTLALMFLAPLVLITLLNYLFNDQAVEPVIGETGLSDELVQTLKENDLKIKRYDELDQSAEAAIKANELDAFIVQDGDKLNVTFENSDPAVSKEITMKLQKSLMSMQEASMQQAAKAMQAQMDQISQMTGSSTDSSEEMLLANGQLTLSTDYVYGNADTTYFDTIGPIFIGFFVFFFVFLIAGISFLRERTTGTLERLMATPIKRYELELGYMIGFGLFALIQSIIVALFSIHVLDMTQNGSIWYVLLITLLLAIVSLALGMLLSTFANNEFQVIQFIPIVIVPQLLFCGIFPLEGMADWLQWIAHLMPMYYGATALTDIMIKGEGFSSFAADFYILVAFAAVFLILNIFALKKYRKV